MPRPNVIYFHTHDTGRYIEPYGAPIRTPRLQAFAEQAVVFRDAHSAAPTCSPSRAGLLTGQWAHGSGMLGLAHRGHRLTDYDQHLVTTLRRNGYHTALAGVQHEAPEPDAARTIGYDERLAIAGWRAADTLAAATDFLQRDHDRPFFLALGLTETHVINNAEWTFGYPGVAEPWVAPPPTMPSTPQTRRDMASFHASAHEVDRTLGAVIDTLQARGLADNTLIIVTTDHGVAMPRMKCTLTSAGTGVMLMIAGPDLPHGLGVDQLVSHVDVFPTLCDYLGIERPDWLQGTSVLPTLEGRSVRDETFAEVTFHVSYDPQRAVRTKRWSYLRRFTDRTRPTLPNVDDSLSKSLWVDAGWADRHEPADRLYDLLFDPHEMSNLAGDPAYADVLADLRGRLDRWMADTADPLLDGPVPPPAGFPPKDPDALSPSD